MGMTGITAAAKAEDEREHKHAHDVVDDCGREYCAPFSRLEFSELRESLGADADARRREDGAKEEGLGGAHAKRKTEPDAGSHREQDAAGGGQQRCNAYLAHLHHVRLEARDEHEEDDADVGEAGQRFAGRHHVHDCGTEGDADEQLAEHGREAEAPARLAAELGSDKDEGQRQQKIALSHADWFLSRRLAS